MYIKDLKNLIFNRHENNNSDELLILGGFIGPGLVDEASKKFEKDKIKCTILYGCLKNKLTNFKNEAHHKYTKISRLTSTKIYYPDFYNHSKIYIWKKNNKVVDTLIGSANFSTSGLCNDFQETLVEVSTNVGEKLKDMILNILDKSTLSTNFQFEEQRKKSLDSTFEKGSKIELDRVISFNPPTARIFLGDRINSIHKAGGLNWGHGKGHNNKSTAYIALRKRLVKDLIPSLFPNNGINTNHGVGQAKKNNYSAEAIFDDGQTMNLSFEGISLDGRVGLYKNLTSFPSKETLGKYFRKRLGLHEEEFITYDHLKKYGRDNIDVSLISEGVYKIDFSQPVKKNNE